MTRLVDRGRSLEELERERWPTPSAGASRLITTAHALRRRPIGELTVEDMRLLIGQDVGLAFLLPLALEVLGDDPMAEGAMYEGDLLSAVLTRSPAVWKEARARSGAGRHRLGADRSNAALVAGDREVPGSVGVSARARCDSPPYECCCRPSGRGCLSAPPTGAWRLPPRLDSDRGPPSARRDRPDRS
ncbi:contact-dependent growth inhibition system immunity protein [Streptomyces tauricus]